MPPLALRPASLHLHRSLPVLRTSHFHTSPHPQASVLFALGALSNSRETQHFNKLSQLERFEHSPNLKLIKSSEVDPFPVPLPRGPFTSDGKEVKLYVPWQKSKNESREAVRVHAVMSNVSEKKSMSGDDKALAAGRAILADIARERTQMRRILHSARRRSARKDVIMQKRVDAFDEERRKMRAELRTASGLVVLSVAAATGLGLYVFWPERVVKTGGSRSEDIGRNLAARARSAIPLPPASSAKETGALAGLGAVSASAVATGEPTVVPAMVVSERSSKEEKGWSWKSLLWKQT